jgi:hypothetical protein
VYLVNLGLLIRPYIYVCNVKLAVFLQMEEHQLEPLHTDAVILLTVDFGNRKRNHF